MPKNPEAKPDAETPPAAEAAPEPAGRGPTSEGTGESASAVNPASGEHAARDAQTSGTPAMIPGSDPLAGLVRGRIVLYWPKPFEERNCVEGPWAAIVTNVLPLGHGHVTLNVQMPLPAPVGEDPVCRKTDVPFALEPTPGHWTWMFDGQGTSRGPVKARTSYERE